MARRMFKANLHVVLVQNGANYDFVVTNMEPFVDDPAGAKPIDSDVRTPDWFDFSKVTAGTPYDQDGIVGRLLGDAVTVAQIKTNVVAEAKSQAEITP